MDSLGDYIYLIAILVVAVRSILGKKKKQAAEAQQTLPDVDEMPDLEDVIPTYVEFEAVDQPVYQPISKKNSTIDFPSYETVKDFSTLRAKKQVNQPAKHFVGSELTVEEDNSFNIIALDTADDVKKAFIYSEIIHRKY